MLKLCDKSICKPLNIIFNSCSNQGIFLSQWKKSNVVPIHKKYAYPQLHKKKAYPQFFIDKVIKKYLDHKYSSNQKQNF